MGAVTIAESRAAEAAAMECSWTEASLVELAGTRLAHAIARFYPIAGTAIAYLGKGHNAADAIVALGVLRKSYGWTVACRCAFDRSAFGPVTKAQWNALDIEGLTTTPSHDGLQQPLILLDALLGIGANGALRAPLVEMAREMANLRKSHGARVVAVDLPSGVDADSGTVGADAVVADVTFMIGNAKLGLLYAPAASNTGALSVVEAPCLTASGAADLELIAPQTMDIGKGHRPFDFHKGQAGRVSIIAGSLAYSGAAVLAATGALRGGAGLITLFVPSVARALISSKCPPEIIVRGLDSPIDMPDFPFDSLVIGCGLDDLTGSYAEALLDIIAGCDKPAVIDASALNLIASRGRLDVIQANHVITPHPGEFTRLATDLAKIPREDASRQFADRMAGTLLFKGSRTLIARKGQPLRCNATGTPGMASGGQGDLLSGVIGALLAGGLAPFDAASLGAWVCGRAAEIASIRESEESLTASDTAAALGQAFNDWKTASR